MKCNQKDCPDPPALRFTWPGQDEAAICVVHAIQLNLIADAMGLHLQLIPLTAEDYLRAAEQEAKHDD